MRIIPRRPVPDTEREAFAAPNGRSYDSEITAAARTLNIGSGNSSMLPMLALPIAQRHGKPLALVKAEIQMALRDLRARRQKETK